MNDERGMSDSLTAFRNCFSLEVIEDLEDADASSFSFVQFAEDSAGLSVVNLVVPKVVPCALMAFLLPGCEIFMGEHRKMNVQGKSFILSYFEELFAVFATCWS